MQYRLGYAVIDENDGITVLVVIVVVAVTSIGVVKSTPLNTISVAEVAPAPSPDAAYTAVVSGVAPIIL